MHTRSLPSERDLAPRQNTPPATASPDLGSVHPPLRVAFVLYRDDSNLGGSLRVVETLAKALDPKRIEAHIIFTYGGPGPVARRSNVPCHYVHSRGPHD